MTQFKFLILGERLADVIVSHETKEPFLTEPSMFIITEDSTELGTVAPTGNSSYVVQVVLPTCETTHNINVLLDVINHELTHCAIIELEGWYTSAQIDSTNWIAKTLRSVAQHKNGFGYEVKVEMRFYKVRKFICWLIGHDWLSPMVKSNVKQFCNRCYTWEKL